MPIVETKKLTEGLIVSANVYSKSGQLIVPVNSCLTRQMISHLRYYNITEVSIHEGEIPKEAQESINLKNDVEKTHLDKLLSTQEYAKFKENYTENVTLVEENFNDIILKNTPIDEPNLITDTVELFEQNKSTYALFGMLHSMKKIDDSTYAHCVNVAIISRLIGSWMKMSKEDLDHLTLAGLLHDIGKCKIPDDILLKPGKLTNQEYEFIKKHPEFGYDIVKDQDLDPRIKNTVLLHHERFDGSGYPFGLTQNKLGDFESIVSIADVYDAMTSNRCYRSALCPFDVISTFEQDGLGKYHPRYILTFLEKIANSYLNSDVLLSNDQSARIIYINHKLTRPVVQVEGESEFINLEERPDVYIQAII